MSFVCSWLNKKNEEWIVENDYKIAEIETDLPESFVIYHKFIDSNEIAMISITQFTCDTNHENEESNHYVNEIVMLLANFKKIEED